MKVKVNEGERIEHDKEVYEAGAEFECSEKDAKRLMDKKLVTPVKKEGQPAK